VKWLSNHHIPDFLDGRLHEHRTTPAVRRDVVVFRVFERYYQEIRRLLLNIAEGLRNYSRDSS
jgi:hypothetical protein